MNPFFAKKQPKTRKGPYAKREEKTPSVIRKEETLEYVKKSLLHPILSPSEAKERGFKPITIDIDPVNEAHIVLSMDRTLVGTTSAWIRQTNGFLQAARKSYELKSTR